MEYKTFKSFWPGKQRRRIRREERAVRNCRLVKVMTCSTLLINRLPVYNGDLEKEVPAAVLDFKKTVAEADGIIIITPEYNFSYPLPFVVSELSVPGALKNAIDWASRPSFGGPNAWKDKVIGIGGVGPQSYEGAHGGLLAAIALRQSTYFLEWKIIDSPKLHVVRASERFNEAGELKPEV